MGIIELHLKGLSLMSWTYTFLSKFLLEFVQMKDKDHFAAKILYYLHRIPPPPENPTLITNIFSLNIK